MAQAAPENKEILGYFRERCKDTSLLSNHCLLSCGYHAHDMKLNRSTYEVLQILGISLTDKTPLRNLFSKTKFNDVKEQSGLDGPNLFSNYNF